MHTRPIALLVLSLGACAPCALVGACDDRGGALITDATATATATSDATGVPDGTANPAAETRVTEPGETSDPAPTGTQPVCVTGGTGTRLHANIRDLVLQNCLGESVHLHATCGTQQALWLVGTTGWCGSCKQFMSDLSEEVGGTVTRQAIHTLHAGLDMLIVLGEDTFGGPPTLDYCKHYAAANQLDPQMVLVDSANPAARIPLVDPPNAFVAITSLGNLWSVMDPYLVGQGGSITTGYPWSGLLRSHNMEYIWSEYAAPDVAFQDALATILP